MSAAATRAVAQPPSLDRDGWTLVPQFVDAREAGALADAVTRQVPRAPTDGGHGILRHDCRAAVPELTALACDGRLGALACALVDADALTLFQDVLVWKTPGATEPLPWHRDADYWPLDGSRGVVLWLAFDDVDADNGCLSIVDGSHLADSGKGTEPSALAARAGPVCARRGDLVAMHPLVWHASSPNPSARQRRAWITTWIDPDTRWAPARAHHPDNYLLAPSPGSPVRGDRFPTFGRGSG
jgi:ectoine hydroxylase-related dioxygenase (phytanoyl-CoA dioxygenase family)